VETRAKDEEKGRRARPRSARPFLLFSSVIYVCIFTQRKFKTIMLNIVITFLRALIPLLQTLLENLEQEQRQDLGNLFAPGHRLRSERQPAGLDVHQRQSASPESSVDVPVRTPSRSTIRPGPSSPLSPKIRGKQTTTQPAWRHLDGRCGGYSHTLDSTTVSRCAWCGRDPSDRRPVSDKEWQRPHRFLRQTGDSWQTLVPAP